MTVLAIIESPYAPGIEFNKRYARAALRDSLRRGESPFASHLLYTQCLNDSTPEERKRGIEAGLAWACRAGLTAVYFDLGVTNGMAEGITHAQRLGREVAWRSLREFSYVLTSSEHAKTLPWAVRPPKGILL